MRLDAATGRAGERGACDAGQAVAAADATASCRSSGVCLQEMSIVGPRPERPEFVEQLSRVIPNYRQRHLIKPGLTGWAQIHLGYGATVDDARRKLGFDLYYLKHRSIDLDLSILIRTLGTFLLGAS